MSRQMMLGILLAMSTTFCSCSRDSAPQQPTQTAAPEKSEFGNFQVDYELPELSSEAARAGEAVQLYIPSPKTLDPPWVEGRRKAQFEAAKNFDVFFDFQFHDQREESGVTFVSQTVDDAGRDYKAVHYDHGCGIAVGDVDADGLYDIYFVTQLGSNELWRNLGGGRFENITERAGVGLADRVGVSASFADIDNDGDPDLYATTVRGGNALFRNDGQGKFTDISKESGIDYVGHSSSAVFFDFDRDGWLDLFLTNVGKYTTDERGPGGYHVGFNDAFSGHLKPERNEASLLFKNTRDGHFVDVTHDLGLVDYSWSGDASPLDANQDGWPDLYVLNMQGHDQYYENVKGQGFVNKSRSLFPTTPWGTMGIKVFDYDNDSRMDVLLTDMHSDMSETVGPEREKLKARMQWPETLLLSNGQSIYGNALFRNVSSTPPASEPNQRPLVEARFEEVSDQVGAENFWPWGPSVGDLNADGYDDVFIASSMNFNWRYAVNTVLLNNLGRELLDAEYLLGVEPRRDGKTSKPWFEIDCSGKDQDHPFCLGGGGRDGRFVLWGALGSRSSVIFDLDDDGDLDIVTNDFNSEPMLLVSNLTERHPNATYLKVKLQGSDSNRSGLGARVQLRVGDQSYTKVHDGKSGYLSQSDCPLYFGLGESKTVDSVEVVWPSGKQQTVEGPLSVNRLLVVAENQAHASPTPPDDGSGEDSTHQEPATAEETTENTSSNDAVETNSRQIDEGQPSSETAYHVYPGEPIQDALEMAAKDPSRKTVKVHAGTYRPQQPGQAMIWFSARHDGITLEAEGEVVLTAANPELAEQTDASYPAVVNHVVFFGDGISPDTVLRRFKITGANHYVTQDQQPAFIDLPSNHPRLQLNQPALELFYYSDGGAIKVFGRSYPTIEDCEIFDNYASPCGAGISVEHRGFKGQEVTLRNCIFRHNRCQVTGSAIDVLPNSVAAIENCLFVGNIANTGKDYVSPEDQPYNATHGSGALTVFHGSHVQVSHCTFVNNWNGIDDRGRGSVYHNSIFWQNNAAGGIAPGGRYELDLTDGSGVSGCFIHGDTNDLHGTIDQESNIFDAHDPEFDDHFRPQAPAYANAGYRPATDEG